MGENTLERYRQDARDLLTAHDPRLRARPTERLAAFGIGDFEDAICALVQRHVARNLEWAALRIEDAFGNLPAIVTHKCDTVERAESELQLAIAAIRDRGRTA